MTELLIQTTLEYNTECSIIFHNFYNWRCSIQLDIFTHQNVALVGIRTPADSGRV